MSASITFTLFFLFVRECYSFSVDLCSVLEFYSHLLVFFAPLVTLSIVVSDLLSFRSVLL